MDFVPFDGLFPLVGEVEDPADATLRLRFAIVTEALLVLTTSVLYPLACDPLPPCAGKVTVWMRGLAAARNANATSPLRAGTTDAIV